MADTNSTTETTEQPLSKLPADLAAVDKATSEVDRAYLEYKKLQGAELGGEVKEEVSKEVETKEKDLRARDDAGKFKSTKATELERAVTALKRAKAPKAYLDKLGEEPEMLEWALGLADQQAESDRNYGALKASKATRELLTPHAEAEKKAEPASAGTEKSRWESLGFVAEEAKALDEGISSHVDARLKPMHEQYGHLDTAVSLVLMRMARSELLGEFPQLKEGDSYKAVMDRVQRRSGDETYRSIEDPFERILECTRDACADQFRQDIRREISESRKELNSIKKASSNLANGKASDVSQYQGMSPEQVAFRLLSEGKSVSEAQAALREVSKMK